MIAHTLALSGMLEGCIEGVIVGSVNLDITISRDTSMAVGKGAWFSRKSCNVSIY